MYWCANLRSSHPRQPSVGRWRIEDIAQSYPEFPEGGQKDRGETHGELAKGKAANRNGKHDLLVLRVRHMI